MSSCHGREQALAPHRLRTTRDQHVDQTQDAKIAAKKYRRENNSWWLPELHFHSRALSNDLGLIQIVQKHAHNGNRSQCKGKVRVGLLLLPRFHSELVAFEPCAVLVDVVLQSFKGLSAG